MTDAALPSPSSSDRALVLPIALVSLVAVALLGWILVLREPPAGDAAALAFMPAVNAAMNALSASCLVLGIVAIKARRPELHKRLMLGALGFSAVFLVGYLAYHFVHGDTRYPEGAPYRSAYLALLASHVILSIVAFPMVLATFALGLRSSFARHKKLAKWTFPIWLYVSVTGVAVFLFLRSAG
jgi:putative membrane protein